MLVSVIIPTYNDWERLSLSLQSLDQQSYGRENIEIIVVNNNPADSIPDNYFVPENCRILVEEQAGSYAARNRALAESKGMLIGFTDSDCIPDKDWVMNAVKFLQENPQISRIAGNIRLFFKTDQLTVAECYDSIYAFRQKKSSKQGLSVTGNMFTYKKVFEEVGLFNQKLMSGGDYEWAMRAEKAGYKIKFGEDVLIFHPARNSIAELVKKEKRVAGWIGHQKLLAIKRLTKYMIPPVNTLMHGRRLRFSDQVSVFFLKYYLNLTRSVEEIKIAFGKNPARE